MQDLLVEKSYDWKTQSFPDSVRYNLGFYSFHELSSKPESSSSRGSISSQP